MNRSGQPTVSQRLLSLDFMRGLIMVLLALEGAGLYEHLLEASGKGPFNRLVQQFFHVPWRGLNFWDCVQPAFMFMAGVAMAYSLKVQAAKGLDWNASCKKTLQRCGWLFFWGVLLYAVHPDGLSFELWNVLTQLSFTTLVAFLIYRFSITTQVIVSVCLLLLTELLYRFMHIPGFDQPFTNLHNFGNYMDLVLMNKINDDGWVAINCIPTAVHTIAGTIAGKIFLTRAKPIPYLLISGLICLAIGYGLDWLDITPVIKRIATSSFTLASLGWCLWFLALSYWWIDIRNHRNGLLFFTVIGMNSIFIYLFVGIVGSNWFNSYIGMIVHPILQPTPIGSAWTGVITSVTIFTLEWLLCYFLYRKKIFFKL